jgi:2-keto-3-deoxy-L-rhamnonate aldolase RhmA
LRNWERIALRPNGWLVEIVYEERIRMASLSAPNPLKELFKLGKVALGMNVRVVRSVDIARIAKTTGHEFIFIDGQHSLFSVETIGAIAQTALGVGVAPLVRVTSCDDPNT